MGQDASIDIVRVLLTVYMCSLLLSDSVAIDGS